ncbi:MAG: serine protease, partial [Nitrospirae bacterium]|nr:serine protease [Nitrospirota bacterium]
GWMNSQGHRKNILTPHWLNQGIGVFISTDDTVYITQNFC